MYQAETLEGNIWDNQVGLGARALHLARDDRHVGTSARRITLSRWRPRCPRMPPGSSALYPTKGALQTGVDAEIVSDIRWLAPDCPA
jgi:hypothetical protein